MIAFYEQHILFLLAGGLGLFLFGLRSISDGLKLIPGEQLQRVLDRSTKTPLYGLITGMLATLITQSSVATALLTVGLVNAGLLSLRQVIGIILGASIGTTITAFLIGFHFQAYALPILAVGAVTYLLAKKSRAQMAGQILFGYGMFFFGLTVMSEGMKHLGEMPAFLSFMSSLADKPVLGLLVGALLTAVMQSSSATVGLLQILAHHGAATYAQTVPVLLGDNLGAILIVLLAARGTSVASRRTALSHALFNLVVPVVGLLLLLTGVFNRLVAAFGDNVMTHLGLAVWSNIGLPLQIAETHAMLNIGAAIIFLPLVPLLVRLAAVFVPEREGVEDESKGLMFIQKRALDTPGVALTHAMKETIRMARLAGRCYYNAVEYFQQHNPDNKQRAGLMEETVNWLQRNITDYVVMVSQHRLTKEDTARAYLILQVLTDVERIGDHCQNIVEQADYATQNRVTFSGEAKEELAKLFKLTEDILTLTVIVLDKEDRETARRVIELDKEVDQLQDEMRKSHIRRLNELKCNGNNGAVFLDVVTHLGRISDHCRNIAYYVLDEPKPE